MRGKLWLLQALTGIVLLVLLAVHLLGNHTPAGLLNYEGVLARLQDPILFTAETLFLVLVAFHALNGLRGVLADYMAATGAGRHIGTLVAGAGVVAVAYGVWLSVALYLR